MCGAIHSLNLIERFGCEHDGLPLSPTSKSLRNKSDQGDPMTDAPLKDQAAIDAAASVADYEHGWSSDIETDFAPKGLNEDTVRFISAKKNEPEWMLESRLKAFRHWLTMTPPDWAKLNIPPIDYQDAYYYAAPKAKPKLGSLDEVDPEILRVYEKLGIPIAEAKAACGR